MDTCNWMTYRRDCDGHYSVVHEGLPVCRYETNIKRCKSYKPTYECYDAWNRCDMDYLFTEVETKTTKTVRDVFGNRYRQFVRKHRPVNTYRTDIYLNY